MGWKIRLDFVDYFRNVTSRTYSTGTAAVSDANTGENYTDALSFAGTLATNAAAMSDCDVYVGSVYWENPAPSYPAASAECEVKNVLSMKFDLDGKIQKGRVTIPAPTYSVILDSNRQVDLPAVRALAFVDHFLSGELLISDGDTADWMRDADIISLKGVIENE